MARDGRLMMGALAALLLAGCTTPAQPPRDPRDPDVWRPATPAHYPLPR